MGDVFNSLPENKHKIASYGSINKMTCSSNSSFDHSGIDEFGYVEFNGKGGRTCPTCKGTGRIAKEQEEELVALIPYNDQRLKPSRTKLYVMIAIFVCLVGSGLALFFVLPRSVTINEIGIIDYNVTINMNESSAVLSMKNRININNTNFFSVQIKEITVEAFYDQISVGKATTPSAISLGPRQSRMTDTLVQASFNKINQLDWLCNLCTNPKIRSHDLIIILHVTQTTEYLQHTEETSLETYKYIDCSINDFITRS